LRAKRALDGLTVGGGTPLAAGLLRSFELAKCPIANQRETVLVLFTDGHANVSLQQDLVTDRENRELVVSQELGKLGREIRKSKLSTVVIETEKKFLSHNGPQRVAELLGAQFVRVQ
jgi:Mg-chelatase subunit ChlD